MTTVEGRRDVTASKKELSPLLNGRTVCSEALVDALPRYTAPSDAERAATRKSQKGGVLLRSGAPPPLPTHSLPFTSLQRLPLTSPVPSHPNDEDTVLTSISPRDDSTDAHVGTVTLLVPREDSTREGLKVPTLHGENCPSPFSASSCGGVRDCSICLAPVGGCSVVVMACLHTFHYECAKEWLSQHDGSCPDCRTKVCVENFTYPQEIDGDAELAAQEQAGEDLRHRFDEVDMDGEAAPHEAEEADAHTVGLLDGTEGGFRSITANLPPPPPMVLAVGRAPW